jgi:hypothetical protein
MHLPILSYALLSVALVVSLPNTTALTQNGGNAQCKTKSDDPVIRGSVISNPLGTKFQAKGDVEITGGCFKNFDSLTMTWEKC